MEVQEDAVFAEDPEASGPRAHFNRSQPGSLFGGPRNNHKGARERTDRGPGPAPALGEQLSVSSTVWFWSQRRGQEVKGVRRPLA